MNNTNVFIREAEAKDAEKTLELIKSIADETDFLTFGSDEIPFTVDNEEKFIEACRKSKNALFIVALNDDEVVASLTFKGGERKRTEHNGEFGMSVLKKYWDNGIGSKMIKYMIDWAKQEGIVKKISLKVRNDNERAINLYKKFGFKQEGIETKALKIKDEFYDYILMGLEIK